MAEKEKLMEQIWITYHPKLQVYLRQLFPSIIDIEDRVSEILLKIFDKLDDYNPDYALSTWIYRLARNSQIDEIRKVTIKQVEFDEQIIMGDENPESLFFKDYEKQQVKGALSKLKPYNRELVYLYYYEEMNYREISEITGVPTGTLKYRMSCSRNQMRSSIERNGNYEKQY